jgi:hypothetical protein
VDAELKNKLCVTLIAARQTVQPTSSATSRSEGRGVIPTTSGHRDTISARGSRPRPKNSKPIQTQLPLTIVSKGRFDKSEPTLHHGEDLDVPTFLRRGIAMN